MVVGSRTGSRHISQPNGINIFVTVRIVIRVIYEILYQNGKEYVKHCPCAPLAGLSDHRCLDNRECGDRSCRFTTCAACEPAGEASAQEGYMLDPELGYYAFE